MLGGEFVGDGGQIPDELEEDVSDEDINNGKGLERDDSESN